jgi:hypothetical protein
VPIARLYSSKACLRRLTGNGHGRFCKGSGGNTPPLLDEARFTALRYLALDGIDHRSHKEQGLMIHRYISWRYNHAYDERLCKVVDRANVA